MRADVYSTMVDVVEEMFYIPIRKKACIKQSGGCAGRNP